MDGLRAVIVTHRAERASARRAAQTFTEQHLGARVIAVFVDDPLGTVGADEPFETVPLCAVDLGGDEGETARLTMLHPPDELADAVRPHVLRHVLGRDRSDAGGGDGAVVSLPADAEVFGPLDSLLAPLGPPPDPVDIVVVPTRFLSTPRDGRLPDEVAVEEWGPVDPVLCALGAGSRPLLEWWCGRIHRSSWLDPQRRRPGSHAWLGEIPSTFAVARLADPAVGVTYLNADEPGRLPARLVRFAGFDPGRPWRLSADDRVWPRVLLSVSPWLRDRCAARAAALAAPSPGATLPITLPGATLPITTVPGATLPITTVPGATLPITTLPGGGPLDAAMRRAYERALLVAEGTGATRPPNPFDPQPDAEPAFLDWLNEPSAPGRTVSRYLAAVHELRPDLSDRFPDPEAPDGFLAWARLSGRDDGLWHRLIPGDPHDYVGALAAAEGPEPGPTPAPPLPGINVVGFFRAELGVGEAGRLLARTVERSGEPSVLVLNSATAHRQEHPFEAPLGDAFPYDVNVVAVNPDALGDWIDAAGPGFRSGRATVGVWFWEVERFPDRFAPAFDLVDEVWVASEHGRRALTAAAPARVEVHRIPLGAAVPAPADPALAAHFGIPDGRFVFLFVFDHASVTERKNPWGLIEAFGRAFPDPAPEGPLLVIKSINAELHVDDAERLAVAAAGRPDIMVADGYISAAERDALMARADAYVSLHRSEGWGLTLAEAMARATPVIATAYSGNLEFMDEGNSFLVPYRLVEIPATAVPYDGCGRWADPDLDAAAAMMRRVIADPAEARRRADRAASDLRTLALSDAGARFVAARAVALRDRSRGRSGGPSEGIPTTPDPCPPDDRPRRDHASRSSPPDHSPSPTPPEVDMAEAPPPPPPYDHPGIGPVHLPSPPPPPEPPTGPKRLAVEQVRRAMQVFVDRQAVADAQRDAAVAHELGLTRLALREVADTARREDARLGADVASFTAAVGGVVRHLEALQADHDRVRVESHDADQALAARLARDIGDLRGDLARIEARLAELTAALAVRAPQSDVTAN